MQVTDYLKRSREVQVARARLSLAVYRQAKSSVKCLPLQGVGVFSVSR